MTETNLLGLDEPSLVTDTGHRIWGGMPVELEAAVLLYAIVRYAKPRLVVESGTGSGRSTRAILAALRANGTTGRLVTFETQRSYFTQATTDFGDDPEVDVRYGASRAADVAPELVFVDTGDERQKELDFWLAHDARPLLVVHDGNRDYGLHRHPGVVLKGHDGVWIGAGKETNA